MERMKFAVKQSDSFWWTFKVPYITDDGEEVDLDVRLRCKRLTHKKWKAILEKSTRKVTEAIQKQLKELEPDPEKKEKIDVDFVLSTQFATDDSILALYADALKQVLVEWDADYIDAPENMTISTLVEKFCESMSTGKAIFEGYARAIKSAKREDGLKK